MADNSIDSEFREYLRTYQGSENAAQKAWRRNLIDLWKTLQDMGKTSNHRLIKQLEYFR